MGKKLNFDDIRNKEKGKIGLVCAAGSSLNKHITLFEDLSNNSKDDYCTICCNEYYEMSNLNPDYWVIANSVMTVANYSNHFNRSNSTLDTPRIQECHITIGHIICELIESQFYPKIIDKTSTPI